MIRHLGRVSSPIQLALLGSCPLRLRLPSPTLVQVLQEGSLLLMWLTRTHNKQKQLRYTFGYFICDSQLRYRSTFPILLCHAVSMTVTYTKQCRYFALYLGFNLFIITAGRCYNCTTVSNLRGVSNLSIRNRYQFFVNSSYV